MISKHITQLIIFVLVFSLLPCQAFAVSKTTPVPTKSTSKTTNTTSDEMKAIEKIKDMVASKVAELKLVEKRGVLGIVQTVNTTQVKIKDIHGTVRTINIDELTSFQSDSKSASFGISDIKPGDEIVFVGLYNKDTKDLLARFVKRVSPIPSSIDGIITDKDTKNYTLTVVTNTGDKKIIDIETSTKTYEYSKDAGTVKSGFSKVSVGIRTLVTGYDNKSDNNRLTAARILLLPDAPLSENMKQYAPSENSSLTPTKTSSR